jgi:two-component system sensor histidine kinase/response regulator
LKSPVLITPQRRRTPEKEKLKLPEVQTAPIFDLPIWDKAGMLARLMNNCDLVKKILEVYFRDLPLQIQTLKARVEAGDLVGAERQAHPIKEASANVGGEQLRALAIEIEKSFRSKNLTDIDKRMSELEMQFELLKEEVRKGNL